MKSSKKRVAAAALIAVLMLSLASCGSMTRKKKYRFGGCEVTMWSQQKDTDSSVF